MPYPIRIVFCGTVLLTNPVDNFSQAFMLFPYLQNAFILIKSFQGFIVNKFRTKFINCIYIYFINCIYTYFINCIYTYFIRF